MKQNDILSGGVIFLFGAVAAILSLQMPIGTLRAPGSGFFPLGLSLLLMLLSAVSMVQALWNPQGEIREETFCEPEPEPKSVLPVIAFLAVMALTTLLMENLGYPVVSFLLMVGLLRILGYKRWPLNLTLSLLTAAGSHGLFVYLLKIPLPRGFLGI